MGHPVQIVHPSIDGGFLLDTDALGKILCADNVKDKSAAVISVTGPLRTGKSFVLSAILGILNGGDLDRRRFEAFIREGFPWKRGIRPNTAGIWLWSEVFLVKRPQGGEVAVLLMDSQGLFGLETSFEDSLSISAFCTLISSVMVYNVTGAIRETDLVHLELACNTALLLKEKLGEEIPPQKLLFLLRDCPHESTIPYGEKGGAMILNELLKTSSGQSPDMEMCGHIFSYFSEIGCFPMPHPGLKLLKLSATDVLPLHLEDGFMSSAQELVHSLFAPDNLLEKQRFGKTMNCGDLFYFVEEIFDAVNTKGLHASSTMPMMAGGDCVVAREVRYCYLERTEKVFGAHYPEVHSSELTIGAYNLRVEDPYKTNDREILVRSDLIVTHHAKPHQELETPRRMFSRLIADNTSRSPAWDFYCDPDKTSEGSYSETPHTEALRQKQKEEQRESSLRLRRRRHVKQPHTPEGISTAGSTSSWW